MVCTACEAAFPDEPALAAHVRATGHRTIVPDLLTAARRRAADHSPGAAGRAGSGLRHGRRRPGLPGLDWARRRGRSRARPDPAHPVHRGRRDRRDARSRRAAAAAHPRRRQGRPERGRPGLVRGRPEPAPEPIGDLRVVYHGVLDRLRDYEVARPAVDRVAGSTPGLRRVWLGAPEDSSVAACVDEVRPWVDGLAAFGAALVAARPDIGLAPLLDEPFNRAKSELHWLEYAVAGAPTIASAFDGPGPYDVIRDGGTASLPEPRPTGCGSCAGLAASGCAASGARRHGRGSVSWPSTVSTRAAEWADAYRWAAAHAGFGRGPLRLRRRPMRRSRAMRLGATSSAEHRERSRAAGPADSSLRRADALRRHGRRTEHRLGGLPQCR